MEAQQPQALPLAGGIHLPVMLVLGFCCLAMHAVHKMLPAIHICCYLPLWEPHIKWVLHAPQQMGLQHYWSQLWAGVL
jgi:hypothetical protein